MKVLHVISGLDTGGAELFLERLALGLAKQEFSQAVVALRHAGAAASRLESAGIPVHVLHAGANLEGLKAAFALRSIVRQQVPDLIQGWLYHGNLGASLMRSLGGACPVIWNVRHSLDDWRAETVRLRAVIRLGGVLSASAARILFNSATAARQHQRLGYPAHKALVVPNGFDCQRFRPDAGLRSAARSGLGIGDKTPIIGMVARYSAIKDHGTFLQAARVVADALPQARFLLVGRDVDRGNPALRQLLQTLQLTEKVLAVGERQDMPALLNAMDICVSSSRAEGFPNAVGEAMACGLPCVVTDVGASAELVGDTGRVVPARAPEALASATLDLLNAGSEARSKMGIAARTRILQSYEQTAVVKQYADLYRILAAPAPGSFP
ncbi:MAG TPA: glycosyltransferase [Gammaproteobacteria bacterium]|nr:glycosyltransferase [Gammaproteobacteria bacterium]